MDDLGIDGDALANPVVVLPQDLGGGFGIYCAGGQMLERGRNAVRLGLPAAYFLRVPALALRIRAEAKNPLTSGTDQPSARSSTGCPICVPCACAHSAGVGRPASTGSAAYHGTSRRGSHQCTCHRANGPASTSSSSIINE